MEGVIRCRTCDSQVSRIVGLVASCERCADRTPLRCPGCRAVLRTSQGTVLECICGRSWSADGARLVDAHGASAAPSGHRGPALPETSREVTIREVGSARADGYRTATVADTLELKWRRTGSPATVSAAPSDLLVLVGCGAVSGLGFVMAVVLDIAGMSDVFNVLIGLVVVAVIGLSVRRRGALTRPARTRGVRFGPERVEVDDGAGWRPLIATKNVRAIVRDRVAPARVRVSIEIANDKRVPLFDDVAEEEAAEVEARLAAHLARMRAR